MRIRGDRVQLAPTDLANHLACRHLTSLDLQCSRGVVRPPDWADPFTSVLRELGLQHEAAYLDHLKRKGLRVMEEAGDGRSGQERTVAAMRDGWDAIYQPTLLLEHWAGRADILLRVDRASDLGRWSYEAVDCKLSCDTRAGSVLQLAVYSECIEAIQGVHPERMHILTPNPDFAPTSFRTAEYRAYYRSVVRRLLAAVVADPLLDPEPTPHCDICRWWQRCNARWRADDHLCFVAGISKLQTEQLREWRIDTLESLSQMEVPLGRRPRRGASQGYVRIREQARVQAEARQSDGDGPVWELLPVEPGYGLARLPEPSPGDLFLDMEGDSFVGDAGLEYLFGCATIADDGSMSYHGRWAASAAEEKDGFERTIDEIIDRLERFPGAHVYHFGHYEPSALKRLMGRYATREDEVDRLLRAEAFVDLHAITRQAVRAGIEAYSLKELEGLHDFDRQTPLQRATVSKRAVERALELSAPSHIRPDDRQAVESYNADDCVSAARLRDWLEGLREEALRNGEQITRPEAAAGDPSEELDERQRETQRLVTELTAGVPVEPADRSPEQRARWLLAHLLDYHRRERKASWWEYYRLRDLEPEEYAYEKSALDGMMFVGRVGGSAKCPVHRYSFPRQETDIRGGDTLLVSHGAGQDPVKLGEVEEVDLAAATIDVKKTQASKGLHPSAVFADPRFQGRSDPRPDALRALAAWVLDNGMQAEGPFGAALGLLLRNPPRLTDNQSCEQIQDTIPSTLDGAKRLGVALDSSVLPIQGPPGAGKTFTGARIICELVRSGHTVGITALGHKAIAKLLGDSVDAAKKEGLDLRCIRKVSATDPECPDEIIQTRKNSEPLDALNSSSAQLAAGTAWLWARNEYAGSVDVLVIDEAGQMPLADVLAVSRAARSLILLGDPAQLEHPQQGSHPDGVAVSAFQHLLGEDRQTIAKESGLFLTETWRLHPRICEFTSEVFYEGKLGSHASTAQQALVGDSPFAGAGLWFVPVEHRANQSSSSEEVDVVDRLVGALIRSGLRWIDAHGATLELRLDDILIVAPYNAQVSDLMSRLPPGARVGTVDKFQGQQAPVVIYSMTTSTPDDAPRGMEFLYSLNRLNVATSRARCTSILVASERLLEPECRTPRQMKLANALCRYVELAETVRPAGDTGSRTRAVAAGRNSGG